MRIAIIGAGISGLTAAYVLSREHEITLFEASEYLGGHTHTSSVDLGRGPCQVDTGFIVFNHRTYPNFTRLLARLGVRSQPSTMSFSVRSDRTGLEYSGQSLAGLFVQRRNALRPAFLRMLVDILRFYRSAPRFLDQPSSSSLEDELTVREYVRAARLSQEFVDHFLIPLGASIWSCPPQRFFDFPARFMIRFMDNHGMLSLRDQPRWRVIENGSARYVEALMRSFRGQVRLNTPIAAVRRFADHVAVVPRSGEVEVYDHAVIACHGDQALAMLEDPSPLEREVLSAFPYQDNEVTLHTDTSVLPRDRRAWSSWNYLIPGAERAGVTLTYNMNILQNLDAPEVACVTVNDGGSVAPERVIRRIRYAHPVFTARAPRYQAMYPELIRRNRTSYCGAYWGFGFHEDGVNSALAVCRAFGLDLGR